MKFVNFSVANDLKLGDFSSRKIVLTNADGSNPVRVQIPRMYMPFGLSGFTPEIGATKWNIDFSMKGHDEDGNYVKKFYDFLKDIETKVITHVHNESKRIFGSEQSIDDLREKFISNIKTSPGREPKFRVKVDTEANNKEIKPSVFNYENVQLFEKIKDGLFSRNSGAAMVDLESVYFMNKKFGLIWRIYQLKVFEPQRLKGFQFVNDIEDTDENNSTNICEIKGFAFQNVV